MLYGDMGGVCPLSRVTRGSGSHGRVYSARARRSDGLDSEIAASSAKAKDYGAYARDVSKRLGGLEVVRAQNNGGYVSMR